MERTDWLDKGFDASDARFLMVTAISHHRFRSPIWGEEEIRKLNAELAEIDRAAQELARGMQTSLSAQGEEVNYPIAGTG